VISAQLLFRNGLTLLTVIVYEFKDISIDVYAAIN